MSKISVADYEKYDELFYEFIQFLIIKNKEKDIGYVYRELGIVEYYDIFMDEIKLYYDDDSDDTYYDVNITDYIRRSYEERVKERQYEKDFCISFASFLKRNTILNSSLIFSPDKFYLKLSSRKGLDVHEPEIKEPIQQSLSYKDLYNFQKLWNKILQLIKETIENE